MLHTLRTFPSQSIRILCILALSIPLSFGHAEARGRRYDYIYHRVKKGEYLGLIARKYRTNIRRIQRLNRLPNNHTLQAGKLLRVGIRQKYNKKNTRNSFRKIPVYHRVKKGESLSLIARRYRSSVSNLRRWNRMGKKSVLRRGRLLVVGYRAVPLKKKKPIPKGTRLLSMTSTTKVKVPLNYTPPKPQFRNFENRYYNLRVFASSFSQGKAAYLEILPRKPRPSLKTTDGKRAKQARRLPASFHIRFLKKDIPLTKTSWGYRAIFAIPPELRPGRHLLTVAFQLGSRRIILRHSLRIKDTRYPVSIWRRNVGRPGGKRRPPNPEVIALIKKSTQKKRQVFRIRSADKFQPRLAHPRDLHKITSYFHTTRKYVRYYYNKRKRVYLKSRSVNHGGTDLRGMTGAPIYAMADGVVVAAQRMFYEGNFTIIDHGNGIFTGYMHQSKFLVYVGEKVTAGQLIGRCGGTGKVTGPHLHMSLWIRGVAVDPLSLLSLPIR